MPDCNQFTQCLKWLSKLEQRYIVVICYQIPENENIKLGWITVRFADMPIFQDNGVLQERELQSDELGNSMYWHVIIAGIPFC